MPQVAVAVVVGSAEVVATVDFIIVAIKFEGIVDVISGVAEDVDITDGGAVVVGIVTEIDGAAEKVLGATEVVVGTVALK